jgi:hypothetical protein
MVPGINHQRKGEFLCQSLFRGKAFFWVFPVEAHDFQQSGIGIGNGCGNGILNVKIL